ncbi:MAG: HNH endonuclease [Actinobacteria bacterium]|nr:HNH endonuclease [Actinomycetota bacterium]
MQTPPTPPPPQRSLDDIAATIDTLADHTTTTGADADGLDAAATLLQAMDRLIAVVIGVLQAADHDEVIATHGLTRDSWLRAVAGRTGADAGMLLAAAERLAEMPAVSTWFRHGVLSWGVVRAIVLAIRNLTGEQRAWVDATLAQDRDRMLRLDGDQLAAAVDGLVNDARADLHRDRERSGLARRWLTIQPRLDGTADIYGTLDPETAAAALSAFAATTIDHDQPHDDSDDDGATGRDGNEVRAERRASNVDRFKALCEQRLTRRGHPDDRDRGEHDSGEPVGDAIVDGGDGTDVDGADAAGTAPASGGTCRHCGSAPSTARPLLLVIADLDALDPDVVGSGTARLIWATSRAPVELTPQAAQRLSCDATLRTVITDGTQILGVTAAHPKVSAKLRAAVIARDGGCRFPACTQPVDVCDIHHVVPVVQGGPTELANLALVCRDHHHAIHDSAWQVTLHDDATVTFTRRNVTLTSQPRVGQHPRRVDPPPAGRPRRHRTTRPTRQPPDRESPAGDADRRPPDLEALPF